LTLPADKTLFARPTLTNAVLAAAAAASQLLNDAESGIGRVGATEDAGLMGIEACAVADIENSNEATSEQTLSPYGLTRERLEGLSNRQTRDVSRTIIPLRRAFMPESEPHGPTYAQLRLFDCHTDWIQPLVSGLC